MKTILITGLGRSGSTIIQKVLNAHPDVFVSDESWHFFQAAHMYSGRSPRPLMGMSDARYAECIIKYIASLYSQVAGNAGLYGDKCPPAFTMIHDIKTLVETGHNTLAIIWTVRHPFDQALSWIERFQKNSLAELSHYGLNLAGGEYTMEQVVELIFKIWKEQQRVMQEHKGYTIQYEKLTESPKHELKNLHEWLDLNFHNNQLKDAFSTAVIGGDPKFNLTQKVHSSSRFRFRKAPENTRKILQKAAENTGIAAHLDVYGYSV